MICVSLWFFMFGIGYVVCLILMSGVGCCYGWSRCGISGIIFWLLW